MRIIEKLGLLPGSRILKSEEGIACGVEATYDLNLVKASPEMLEALIEEVVDDELYTLKNGHELSEPYFLSKFGEEGRQEFFRHEKRKSIIEKATGKSWEQLEDILNANPKN